jgi:hypothetical protein
MLISINWALLREQKTWLLNQPVCAEADGLVNLIDALQDGAVDAGVSEDVVFGEQAEFLFDEA